MFNPKRLSLARTRRRLTAKALAAEAGLAPDTISRLENGLHNPDDATVDRVAHALAYPAAFFFEGDVDAIDENAVSFRSFSKMSAKERNAALGAGNLGLQLSRWIDDRFSLPTPNVLDLSDETDPEMAALVIRQHWGIGERPIGNVIGLLETHGIRILSLAENTASVNAFSFWRDDSAYIFLNNFKTPESSIFDTAHELGHLVMHKHGGALGDRNAEREADRFASAFLMPANDIRSRISYPINIDTIIRSKARWRVSAMAMCYRLRSLEILSEWQYKSLCIELGRRGYRSSEPNGIERETSIVWKKILSHLWSNKTTKNDIARDLCIPLDELEGLIWNLTGTNERPKSSRIDLVP